MKENAVVMLRKIAAGATLAGAFGLTALGAGAGLAHADWPWPWPPPSPTPQDAGDVQDNGGRPLWVINPVTPPAWAPPRPAPPIWALGAPVVWNPDTSVWGVWVLNNFIQV